MKSDFERNAARGAVEAVEARWRRQHELDRKLAFQRSMSNWLGFLALIVMAVGGYFGWRIYNGERIENLINLSSFQNIWRVGGDDESGKALRKSYSWQLQRMLTLPVKLLSELPAHESPKKASVGTVYPVLSAVGDKGFNLYRLSKSGAATSSVTVCSPFGGDRNITMEAFKKECTPPYLIEIGDCVYLCGSKDIKDAERIRNKVMQQINGH